MYSRNRLKKTWVILSHIKALSQGFLIVGILKRVISDDWLCLIITSDVVNHMILSGSEIDLNTA